MGKKQFRKRFVDVVLESTYGVDPGSGRTALLPRSDLSLEVSGENVNRDVVRQTLSNRGHVVTSKQQSLTLPLELRGAGLDGTSSLQVPETDSLLKASLMQRSTGARITVTSVTGTFERGETVSNTTAAGTVGTVADWDSVNAVLYIRDLANMPSSSDSLTGDTSGATADADTADDAYVYRPASPSPDSQASVFGRFQLDGTIHNLPGARATFDINMTVGDIPQINFTLSTLYVEPIDGSPISGDFLKLAPSTATGVEIILGALDTTKVTVNQLSMDISNSVEQDNDIKASDGVAMFMVTGRDPTGSIDPSKLDIAEFNPYSDWSAANEIAVAGGVGSALGERVRVVAPTTQYDQVQGSSRAGLATYSLPFNMIGNDDEMMLIYS